MSMNLTITIPSFNSGVEMEKALNRAIKELSTVLLQRGLVEMELVGHDFDNNLKLLYEVQITKGPLAAAQVKLLREAVSKIAPFIKFYKEEHGVDLSMYEVFGIINQALEKTEQK